MSPYSSKCQFCIPLLDFMILLKDFYPKMRIDFVDILMHAQSTGITTAFTGQKMKFSIKDFSVNVTKSAGNCGFGHTLIEEILIGKLHILYNVYKQTKKLLKIKTCVFCCFS